MNVYVPAYYNQFQCLAGKCPDSCCKEWVIDIDADSAAKYFSMEGPLGDNLRQFLKSTEDGTILEIKNGRCPMWRQDGLCEIQAQLGHDALCKTCREYPRIRHDYGDFVELGLELSCPEAARLILTAPDRSYNVTSSTQTETPEYDQNTMNTLLRSRKEILSFLENTTYSLPQSLTVLLLYAHAVQEELDSGTPANFNPKDMLLQAEKFPEFGNMQDFFRFFTSLEILTPKWKDRLEAGSKKSPWSPVFRPLAIYFVQRYWLQAVSDYDLIGRAKFTVSACLLIHALGGDVVLTAQLFSKEIENNPDNMDAILDGAYTSPALTDLAIIHLLNY